MSLKHKTARIGKLLLGTFIGFIIVLLLSHVAIKFGVEAGSIKAFFDRTWAYWLVFRLALYAFGTALLYMTYQKSPSESLRQNCKRFGRIGVVMILATEFTVFMQLIRG